MSLPKYLVAVLFLAVPAFGQYKARTDRSIAPYPTLPPAIRLQNSSVVDPQFGSTIYAVTDWRMFGGYSFYTTNDSGINTWAPDETQLFFGGKSGQLYTASFDPDTGTVGPIVEGFDAAGLGKELDHAEYCFKSPTTAIGVRGYPGFYEIRNGVETLIHDASTEVGLPYADDVHVNFACNRFSMSTWTSQGSYGKAYVWDSTLKGYSYVDGETMRVITSWRGGYSGPLVNHTLLALQPSTLHDSRITRDGDYMEITPGNIGQVWIWQIGTANVWAYSQTGSNSPACIGSGSHDALGFSVYYDACQTIPGLRWYPDGLVAVIPWVNPTHVETLTNGFMADYVSYGWDYHISANDAFGSPAGAFDTHPIFMATENNDGTGVGQPEAKSPGENEIIGICTSCLVPTMWRFAHTEYNYKGLGQGRTPCCGPTGNVSPDGRWFVWTSNWDKTRGLDPKGNPRTDVFVVDLTSAHPVKGTPVKSEARE